MSYSPSSEPSSDTAQEQTLFETHLDRHLWLPDFSSPDWLEGLREIETYYDEDLATQLRETCPQTVVLSPLGASLDTTEDVKMEDCVVGLEHTTQPTPPAGAPEPAAEEIKVHTAAPVSINLLSQAMPLPPVALSTYAPSQTLDGSLEFHMPGTADDAFQLYTNHGEMIPHNQELQLPPMVPAPKISPLRDRFSHHVPVSPVKLKPFSPRRTRRSSLQAQPEEKEQVSKDKEDPNRAICPIGDCMKTVASTYGLVSHINHVHKRTHQACWKLGELIVKARDIPPTFPIDPRVLTKKPAKKRKREADDEEPAKKKKIYKGGSKVGTHEGMQMGLSGDGSALYENPFDPAVAARNLREQRALMEAMGVSFPSTEVDTVVNAEQAAGRGKEDGKGMVSEGPKTAPKKASGKKGGERSEDRVWTDDTMT